MSALDVILKLIFMLITYSRTHHCSLFSLQFKYYLQYLVSVNYISFAESFNLSSFCLLLCFFFLDFNDKFVGYIFKNPPRGSICCTKCKIRNCGSAVHFGALIYARFMELLVCMSVQVMYICCVNVCEYVLVRR